MIKQLLRAKLETDIIVGEEELASLEVSREQRRLDREVKAQEDEKQRLKEEADAAKKKKAVPKKKKADEEEKQEDEEEKKEDEEEEKKKPKMTATPIEFDYFFSNYVKSILNNRIILPKMDVRHFSHVVDLREDDDQEILHRAENTLERILITLPQDEEAEENNAEEDTKAEVYKACNVYSQYDRA